MSKETLVDHAEVYRELDAKAKEYRGLANEALAKWQSGCEHDVVKAVRYGDGWSTSYNEIRVCRKCGYYEYLRDYKKFAECDGIIPRVTWDETMRIRRIAT